MGDSGEEFEEIQNLKRTVKDYLERLEGIRKYLKEGDLEKVQEEGEQLLQLSDDMLMLCHMYLDFIHPVRVQIDRTGELEEERIKERKEEILDNLLLRYKRLSREYQDLVRE